MLLAASSTLQVVLLLCANVVRFASAEEDLIGSAYMYRAEIRIASPETQCDKQRAGHLNRDWMSDMGEPKNYEGLLEFGMIELDGAIDVGGCVWTLH